jgi:hypothetical protein
MLVYRFVRGDLVKGNYISSATLLAWLLSFGTGLVGTNRTTLSVRRGGKLVSHQHSESSLPIFWIATITHTNKIRTAPRVDSQKG